jgi:hypothetical protein
VAWPAALGAKGFDLGAYLRGGGCANSSVRDLLDVFLARLRQSKTCVL